MPTLDTIGPMKTAAYQAADQLGAAYKPEAISDLMSKISDDAKASNIDPRLNPRARRRSMLCRRRWMRRLRMARRLP